MHDGLMEDVYCSAANDSFPQTEQEPSLERATLVCQNPKPILTTLFVDRAANASHHQEIMEPVVGNNAYFPGRLAFCNTPMGQEFPGLTNRYLRLSLVNRDANTAHIQPPCTNIQPNPKHCRAAVKNSLIH